MTAMKRIAGSNLKFFLSRDAMLSAVVARSYTLTVMHTALTEIGTDTMLRY